TSSRCWNRQEFAGGGAAGVARAARGAACGLVGLHVTLLGETLPFNELLTLTFSAKESLFKALYPQVRRYFDFLDARMVAVDAQRQTFELALLTTLTPHCCAGRRFARAVWREGDDVTTFIFAKTQ
ncbi:4'-phosphopantetheinyl transferase superfamily protein, partial [Serratia ureilytica]|nr:4'-phosphopantetheinyl transferase superfamily protein [Serratia ureilytica]